MSLECVTAPGAISTARLTGRSVPIANAPPHATAAGADVIAGWAPRKR
jgi:hypothetical protein